MIGGDIERKENRNKRWGVLLESGWGGIIWMVLWLRDLRRIRRYKKNEVHIY